MNVSSVPFIGLFFFLSGLSLSHSDFAFLLSKFKHLKNHSIGYAFSSCFFFFLNLGCAVPHDDKAAEAGAGFRAACAMIQQVVKGRNAFFFGKGWERKGRHA